MKPSENTAQPQPISDVSAPPAAPAPSQTDKTAPAVLAEPPKNLEFTEVPSDAMAPANNRAESEHDAGAGTPPASQPSATPPKPPKEKSGSKPILAITLVLAVFLGLAVVAFLAYTKSQ
jgi:hypothetical protein